MEEENRFIWAIHWTLIMIVSFAGFLRRIFLSDDEIVSFNTMRPIGNQIGRIIVLTLEMLVRLNQIWQTFKTKTSSLIFFPLIFTQLLFKLSSWVATFVRNAVEKHAQKLPQSLLKSDNFHRLTGFWLGDSLGRHRGKDSAVRREALSKGMVLDRKSQMKQTVTILSRPIVDGRAVSADVPRLCRRIRIFEDDVYIGGGKEDEIEDEFHESNDSRSRADVLLDILSVLSEKFGDGIDLSLFPSEMKDDMLGEGLRDFAKTAMKDQHRTAKVLKSMNQSAIAPSLMPFKLITREEIPNQDIPCSWHIDCNLRSNLANTGYDSVDVHHRKSSRHIKEKFSYTWNFVMMYDGEMNFSDMSRFVSNIHFAEYVSKVERDQIRESLGRTVDFL